MAYNLWYAKREDIKNFYYNRKGSKSFEGQTMLGDKKGVSPIALNIDGVMRENLTLDEIDSFTCQFKSEEELYEALQISPNDPVYEGRGMLVIGDKDDIDNIGKFQVVFNNAFLQRCAMNVREHRKIKGPNIASLVMTDEVEKFIQGIAAASVDVDASKSLFKFDILDRGVKEILDNYRTNFSNNYTPLANRNFDQLTERCLNYKVLRSLSIWEEEYLEEQRKIRAEQNRIKAEKAAETRARNRETIEITRRTDDYRSTSYERPIFEDIAQMRDEDGNLDFDRIFSQYDQDDIFGFNDETLRRNGVIPINSEHNGKRSKTR